MQLKTVIRDIKNLFEHKHMRNIFKLNKTGNQNKVSQRYYKYFEHEEEENYY